MNDEPAARRFLTNRRLLCLVGAALVFVLLIMFIAENFILVEIRLIATRVRIRLVWALFAAFAAGGVIGVLVGRMSRKR